MLPLKMICDRPDQWKVNKKSKINQLVNVRALHQYQKSRFSILHLRQICQFNCTTLPPYFFIHVYDCHQNSGNKLKKNENFTAIKNIDLGTHS